MLTKADPVTDAQSGYARSLDRASLMDTIPAMNYREGQRMADVSIVSDSEIDRISGLHEAWQRIVRDSRSLGVIYQSRDWWECTIHPEAANSHRVAVLRDGQGEIVGVVPFHISDSSLDYTAGSHTFWRHRFRSLQILGGEPLVPPDVESHCALVHGLLEAFPECDAIVLDPVQCNSPAWRTVCGQGNSQRMTAYLPEGRRLAYAIQLPATFGEYRARFGNKARREIDRNIRRLRGYGDGKLELARFDRPEQIGAFLDQAEEVSQHTWQEREVGKRINKNDAAKFERLAERGIFCSYVLHSGGVPCAFTKGLLFQSVFQSLQTGYDQRLAKYSPGTGLLWMMLENLIEHDRAERFNLSHGRWWYKQWFSRCPSEEARVMLLRSDWGNRLRSRSHAAFRASIGTAKRMLGRKSALDPVPGT